MENLDRRAPFEHTQTPADPAHLLETGLAYMRLVTIGLGILLILVGLYLAMNVFVIVRGVIESPEKLVAYLDSWESTMQGRGEDPGEAKAEGDAAEEAASPAQAASGPLARRHRPRETDGSSWDTLIEVVAEAARAGAIARPIGALFIFLFTCVLVRIPISIILTGNRMVLALVVRKKGE